MFVKPKIQARARKSNESLEDVHVRARHANPVQFKPKKKQPRIQPSGSQKPRTRIMQTLFSCSILAALVAFPNYLKKLKIQPRFQPRAPQEPRTWIMQTLFSCSISAALVTFPNHLKNVVNPTKNPAQGASGAQHLDHANLVQLFNFSSPGSIPKLLVKH